MKNYYRGFFYASCIHKSNACKKSFQNPQKSFSFVLFSFYDKPEMAEDLISTYTPFSHCLVAISIGEYFIEYYLVTGFFAALFCL